MLDLHSKEWSSLQYVSDKALAERTVLILPLKQMLSSWLCRLTTMHRILAKSSKTAPRTWRGVSRMQACRHTRSPLSCVLSCCRGLRDTMLQSGLPLRYSRFIRWSSTEPRNRSRLAGLHLSTECAFETTAGMSTAESVEDLARLKVISWFRDLKSCPMFGGVWYIDADSRNHLTGTGHCRRKTRARQL